MGTSNKPRLASKKRREKALEVDALLTELYPDAHCALNHDSAFELLVATVLSAQTTDARVNSVTPELFRRWPTPQTLAGAPRSELEAVLRPLGFFRAKAGHLLGLGEALTLQHDGVVPQTLEELVKLPGVGRKTANVVLGNAFGVPGITVDTHVGRLSRRLGWSKEQNPVKVERDIAALLPPEHWTYGCHRLIEHGRAVCHSRKPACEECELLKAGLCPQVGV